MAINYTVTLTRKISQRTSPEKNRSYIKKMVDRALKGPRGKGWQYKIGHEQTPKQEDSLWVFNYKVMFEKTRGHKSIAPKQWESIARILIKQGQNKYFGSYPWSVSGENTESISRELTETNDTAAPAIKVTVKNYSAINLDPGTHFDHIFGRKNQIKIIHSAITTLVETNLQNRYHCVLPGEPGCGKSEILSAFGRMLGKEDEAYLKLDATSMTEAGVLKILFETPQVPPVLMVEEIEKADERCLRWLLGVLDHRAEIRKTNFHIGHRAKNIKMLCLATVNDIQLFKRAMSGALYSRFAHEVYCPRPDRTIMEQILRREVTKIKGNFSWIEKTLEFCMDECKMNDPRKIVPICLCGRDDLLNGSYQESLRALRNQQSKDAECIMSSKKMAL